MKKRDKDWFEKYNEFLKSYEWTQVCRFVNLRSNFVCESCKKRGATHHHHVDYKVFKQTETKLITVVSIEEHARHVQLLCEKCHLNAHGKKRFR